MPQLEDKKKEVYLNMIDALISDMKFGTISIIVQDGRVIQIDRTDKIRLKS